MTEWAATSANMLWAQRTVLSPRGHVKQSNGPTMAQQNTSRGMYFQCLMNRVAMDMDIHRYIHAWISCYLHIMDLVMGILYINSVLPHGVETILLAEMKEFRDSRVYLRGTSLVSGRSVD
jgi:hypothetical protein